MLLQHWRMACGASPTPSLITQEGTGYSTAPCPPTTASISVSPPQTTSYTVTSGPAGCSVSHTHTIEVEPLPSGAIQGPARICAGQAATLTTSGGVQGAHLRVHGDVHVLLGFHPFLAFLTLRQVIDAADDVVLGLAVEAAVLARDLEGFLHQLLGRAAQQLIRLVRLQAEGLVDFLISVIPRFFFFLGVRLIGVAGLLLTAQ